jgi:ubiquinone/menaquinone biosynthesis C-methylase UbiE
MGFYSEFIFPSMMEFSMSQPLFAKYRQELLANVSGEVLEIGFGTGLNLPHYPCTVEKLTIIDPNPGMKKYAQKRIEASAISVESQILNSEKLPMADNSFDSVVSTWTLCSIANVDRAIAEIHRVLKPEGKFFFLEHGLSQESRVQTCQNILTPVQKIIADGCHLNRNIKQLVANKFKNLKIEEFYAPNLPKFIGYMYKGIAIKLT